MRALLSVGLFLLTFSLASPVRAQEKSGVALISLEISGDGPPELRQQLQKQISEGLAVQGIEVTDLDASLAALKDTPELIGCSSTACLERIAQLIPATRFVRAVVVASGATYELKLDLLTLSQEQPVGNSIEESCAVCTISDLNSMAVAAASKLLEPSEDQLLRVRITTEPAGAMISIDGLEAGYSPLETSLRLGEHRVIASQGGRTGSETTIAVLADGSEQQHFELVLPGDFGKSHAGIKDYGPAKWGALGGSGALLILGSVLIAIDGNPSCSSTTRSCPQLRSTMTGGILSLSSALLAGAAGGWMFWQEKNSQARARIQFSATRDGALGRYSFRF